MMAEGRWLFCFVGGRILTAGWGGNSDGSGGGILMAGRAGIILMAVGWLLL